MQQSNTTLPTNDEGNTATQRIIENALLLSGLSKLLLVQNKYFDISECVVSRDKGSPFDHLTDDESEAVSLQVWKAFHAIQDASYEINNLHQAKT